MHGWWTPVFGTGQAKQYSAKMAMQACCIPNLPKPQNHLILGHLQYKLPCEWHHKPVDKDSDMFMDYHFKVEQKETPNLCILDKTCLLQITKSNPNRAMYMFSHGLLVSSLQRISMWRAV